MTLTGATSELDKISEVVAPVSHEGSLSDSVSATASLELRDENGDIVTPEYTTLDSNTADINLTVYQVRNCRFPSCLSTRRPGLILPI